MRSRKLQPYVRRRLTVLAACFSLLAAGCSKPPAPPPPAAIDATAITVAPQDAPMVREFVAQTQSSREVEITARVDGFLERQPAIRQTEQQLAAQHRQVEALGRYAYLARLRYDNGYTSYIEVLDAERSLFQAQLQLVQTQGQLYFALINLYKALGGGWVEEAERLAPPPALTGGSAIPIGRTVTRRRWS